MGKRRKEKCKIYKIRKVASGMVQGIVNGQIERLKSENALIA